MEDYCRHFQLMSIHKKLNVNISYVFYPKGN